jgi:hypothetical protein
MAIKAIVTVVAMDIFGLRGTLAWYAAYHELDTHRRQPRDAAPTPTTGADSHHRQ